MARLHLMVGLPGVGKTRRALALQRDLPALRLSADDLHLALFADDARHPDHNLRHDRIEAVLWPMALAALRAGADVVLDFGFWSRQERDGFRSQAAAAGFGSSLHVPQDPGTAVRLARIATREAGFSVSAADMADYEMRYEPPQAAELTDWPPEPVP
jgi:predicted kinase